MVAPREGVERRTDRLADALFTGVRRRVQPVEKVVIELVATTNRASKAPKAVYLVPNLGLERAQREFFNTLGYSPKFVGTEFSEVRQLCSCLASEPKNNQNDSDRL